MATWKITVKDTITYNGVNLGNGMFVEYATPTLDNFLYKTTHHDAKEPGPNFREDFDKHPVLYDRLERVPCPRVHFKMIVFDSNEVYIGSANLTGAGIGMKTDNKRNFEAGILTEEPEIVEQAINQFDEVWIGKHCKSCKRREYCSAPIV